MTNEVAVKIGRLRSLLDSEKLENILLTTTPNFFWLTGGKNGFVDKSSASAAVKLLIDREKAYVICNSSERYRVMDEELMDGSFELIPYLWHDDEEEILSSYLKGEKTGSDSGIYGTRDISAEIQKQRYVLTPAGSVTGRLVAKGYQVPVCLVASDERMFKYRHPLPTTKKIRNYAMIAICGQKYGLTISISRIVSFGVIPEEVQKKYEALLKIDATYILNTKAGVKSQDILKKAYDVYNSEGYEADFHLHHQGGALGYLTRDYCTNFRTPDEVLDHQGYSWNPTIAGVKLEDTYIVNGDRQNIVSYTGTWKYRDVEIDGKVICRPDILVL